MPHTDRIRIITVTHNSQDVIGRMLGSVPDGVETIVVDNASGRIPEIPQTSHISLHQLDSNIGFGRACNRGADGAQTEFLLFLNPDSVLDPGCLEALIEAADTHPNAVAFNPAIRTRTGGEYFKRRSVLIPRSGWMPRGWPADDCAVPVLSGSALFVRRDAFDAIGGFDPNIFLYHEDDDLSLRLRAGGAQLWFVRKAGVMHDAGTSAPRSPETAALKGYHMGFSRVYCARKHGVPFGVLRAFAHAIAQVVSPVSWLSKRKFRKHAAFLRGAWRALRRS